MSSMARLIVTSALVVAFVPLAAVAAPSYSASASASANGVVFDTATPGSSASFVSADAFADGSPSLGSGGATAEADYRVRNSARSTGVATGNGLSAFSETFTNTSGTSQDYFFDFTIFGGFISADAGPNTGGTAKGRVDAVFKLNNVKIWGLDLEFDETGATDGNADDDGTLTGFTIEPGRMFWSPSTFTVSLGTIASGGIFSISYSMEAAAESSELSLPTSGCLVADGIEILTGTCAGTNVTTSDPGQLTRFGGLRSRPSSTSGGNQVPEPASLALLGLGLAGLAAARRKR